LQKPLAFLLINVIIYNKSAFRLGFYTPSFLAFFGEKRGFFGHFRTIQAEGNDPVESLFLCMPG